MTKAIKLLAGIVIGLAAISCSSAEKMANQARKVKFACEPEILEVVAGKIDAELSITFPSGYFYPEATMEIIPVLVYDGGEAIGETLVYQGKRVKDNNNTIPSSGKIVTEQLQFDYVKGMELAYLELRSVVKYNDLTFNLKRIKIADGCNTTYMLVDHRFSGNVSFKKDNYMESFKETKEGQLLYNINSAKVSDKALKSKSIKNFQKALDEIKKDSRKTIKSMELVAYASPDGEKNFNNTLSDERSSSADKVWNKVTKGTTEVSPEIKSVGEDWEGFEELVTASNIEDKDLILRIISMYNDPELREIEIKNLSEIYNVLKKEVLPELRRARFIANVEHKNYTEEELLKLAKEKSDILDEEALLKVASILKNSSKKLAIYEKAVERFNSDRAKFNIGVIYLKKNKIDDAEKAFSMVETKDADLENALGVIALRKGDFETAEKYFSTAGTVEANINMGTLNILSGNYEKAALELEGSGGHNEALAYILTNQLDKAENTIKNHKCPRASYIKAIIAARKGDAEGVKEHLKAAGVVKAFAERAVDDIEFANYLD